MASVIMSPFLSFTHSGSEPPSPTYAAAGMTDSLPWRIRDPWTVREGRIRRQEGRFVIIIIDGGEVCFYTLRVVVAVIDWSCANGWGKGKYWEAKKTTTGPTAIMWVLLTWSTALEGEVKTESPVFHTKGHTDSRLHSCRFSIPYLNLITTSHKELHDLTKRKIWLTIRFIESMVYVVNLHNLKV